MKVLEMEGKTVDDAIKKGLAELGIMDASQVNTEVIDEGKSGIFGFGVSKPAKIRIFYNENTQDIGNQAKEVLIKLFELMEFKGSIKDLKEGESKVYIEIESATNSGLIIGKKGKTLESIQLMLNLIVLQSTGIEKKIILDIEGYRAKRERALRKISKDIAYKVIKTGRPWTLEPMNPFERRLIHMALQNDSRVTTKSEGQGIYRKVTISPSRDKM